MWAVFQHLKKNNSYTIIIICIVAEEILLLCVIKVQQEREKKEQQVLEQGIRLPRPDRTSKEPLLTATTRPATLPTVDFAVPFTYTLPENTVGQAKVRGNPSQPVISPSPLQSQVQSIHLPVQLAQSP